MRVRALAPAKVNLCLFLGGLRPDGRHELVTLFESISLADRVELSVGAPRSVGAPQTDEVMCPGVEGPNIVSRALELLRSHGWMPPPVRVRIDKRIPVAAGMGGGSADAAAMLRLAPAVAPTAAELLAEIAAALGADVPSQLQPGLVLGTAAGDEVRPAAPRAAHAFVVVPQPAGLSTAAVYARADELELARNGAELDAVRAELEAALESDSDLPSRLMVNDLEPAAISLCPAISEVHGAVREAGADHALVCGSGPTVAGLYWGEDGEQRADAAARGLAEQFPGVCLARPVERGFGSPVF